jgi:uncharacterized membrane protein
MDYFTKSRVETFSDGIFAIIVTLLVLELKAPHLEASASVSQLAGALWALAPKFIAWVISFLTVCVIWVNHHRIFESVRHINHAFFWLNANLLLWVSFTPFPTALLGDYPENKLAVSFYGVVSILMGLAFLLMRVYMWRHPEITKGFSAGQLRRGARNVLLFGPTFYFIGTVAAWFHTHVAFVCYAFVAIYFIFPNSARLGQAQEANATSADGPG